MENLKCEERIDEDLKARIKEFKNILESIEKNDGKVIVDGEEFEDIYDWVNQCVYSIDEDPHYRAKRMLLSWGGPEDYFLFFEDGTIIYYLKDWGDYAFRELKGNDLAVMEEIWSMLKEYV